MKIVRLRTTNLLDPATATVIQVSRETVVALMHQFAQDLADVGTKRQVFRLNVDDNRPGDATNIIFQVKDEV